MANAIRKFEIADVTLRTLEIIEGSKDDQARQRAISQLGLSHDPESSRILISLWHRILWRSSKKDIIRALGHAGGQRATQFLIRIASNVQDLAMASEAILALGFTNSGLVGEFLLAHLIGSQHPLKKEFVIALGNMPLFPCAREFRNILHGHALSETTIQHLILALSSKGERQTWPEIRSRISHGLTSIPDAELCAIFVAAGRIADASDLDFLKDLDTRHRFLAHQLKQDAIETILRRSRFSIEDVMTDAISAPTDVLRNVALGALRLFPLAESRKTLEVLKDECTIELQCLIRSVLADDKFFNEDLQFVLTHRASISAPTIASLIRAYQHLGGGKNAFSELWKGIPISQCLKLLEIVRDFDSARRMRNLMESTDTSTEVKIELINALVSQATMCEVSSDQWQEIATCLNDWALKSQIPEISDRAIRALGQMQFQDPNFIQLLAKMIKDRKRDTATIYSCLGQIGSAGAVKVLLKRLKTINGSSEFDNETHAIVRALTQVGRFPDDEQLPPIAKSAQHSAHKAFLVILAQNTAPELVHLIREALDSDDYEMNLLGIAAAKYNYSPEIFQMVFRFLNEENFSLAMRSLDTIAIGGRIGEHRQLFDWLSSKPISRPMVEKILVSLKPEGGVPYNSIVVRLDRLLSEEPSPFDDREIQSIANKLRDRLTNHLRSGANHATVANPGNSSTIDASLESKLRYFGSFSEVIKAVLRNAELTWAHPELFHDQVDKSTIVIEFTKSIDLLLQERIGHFLFAHNDATVLMQLQSRVILLDLEDKSTTAEQRIKDLQCSQSFEPQDFPEHKLRTIGSAILSGKIFHDQYQVIDGLRAWSLILLIFGRTFKHSGQILKPVVAMKDTGADRINRIAAQMNLLQEVRNRAAHRGTLLLQDQIAAVREHCYGVLNELSEILP